MTNLTSEKVGNNTVSFKKYRIVDGKFQVVGTIGNKVVVAAPTKERAMSKIRHNYRQFIDWRVR